MTDSRLYYIHDPMCSWCYAFSESLIALQQGLPVDIKMIYVLGGLASDTEEPMPDELRSTIQQTWRRIEQVVPGVHFNHKFWALNTPMRSTYLACRALLASRAQGMEFEDKLLKAIQSAYYQKARNPSLISVLQECAAEVGLDETKFNKDLRSKAIDKQLQDEIHFSRSQGVSSYPSLLLEKSKKVFDIRVDYLNHQTMIDKICEINSLCI